MKRIGKQLPRIAAAVGMAAGAVSILLQLAGASPTAAKGSIGGVVGVSGTVTVTAPPEQQPIDVTGDRYCSEANSGRQVLDRAVVADAQGRLANVVVYIRNGSAAGGGEPPAEPILLDQQNCEYTPRVVALRVNQPIIIRNSDATLHNVHIHAQNNREFNIGQPMKGLESRRQFGAAEVGIHVTCDIHGWMHGAIAVFDHPFHDVSGTDGSFSIDALPPGTYVVVAWHEMLGVKEQSVTVTAGGTAEVSFVFDG
jgi:hypothetical protein